MGKKSRDAVCVPILKLPYVYLEKSPLALKKKDFIYLFLERREGKEKERERNINGWLPLACPKLGTRPTTQACVLTGSRTGNPLVCRPTLNPLSYTSQSSFSFFKKDRALQNLTKGTEIENRPTVTRGEKGGNFRGNG